MWYGLDSILAAEFERKRGYFSFTPALEAGLRLMVTCLRDLLFWLEAEGTYRCKDVSINYHV